MPDLIQDVLLIAKGVFVKADKAFDLLVKEGEEASHGLSPREEIENRLVEEGIKIVRKGVKMADSAGKRIEETLVKIAGDVLEKLDVVREERADVIEKLTLDTRQMVEELKSRVEALEKQGGKG